MKNLDYAQIKELINKNPFTRYHYRVTVELRSFIEVLMTFTHGLEQDFNPSVDNFHRVFEAVPLFQRDNNKWTVDMQESFIQNVLKGCATEIMLFEVNDTSLCDCKILDGLQRLTAIYLFRTGQIKAFGKTFDELVEHKIIRRDPYLMVKIHQFSSEAEAVKFYIEINENITHSADDILKAKRYLTTLQGI